MKRHSKRGKKDGKSKRGARLSTVCLSMYSITENIYYSQRSSVAILLQPEPVSRLIIQGNDCFLSLCAIVFGLPLPPTCLVPTVSEARSYFASTIRTNLRRSTTEAELVRPMRDLRFSRRRA
jgi:hypothetical protein